MIGIELLLLVIASLMGLAAYVSRKIMYPKTRDYETVKAFDLDRYPYLAPFLEEAPLEEIDFMSEDGLIHKGWWLEVPNAKGIVVIIHGIRMNRYASLKYMKLFSELGYTTMTFDLRNHGDSIHRDTFTTYGYLEQYDVKAAVDYVIHRKGFDLPIYTHGESMGATTVLMHAEIDHRIKGVIADCGFVTANRIFKEILWRENHLPSWPLLKMASLINWLKTGVWYKQMTPMHQMSSIGCPVLLIHGDADSYVVPGHASDLKRGLEMAGKKVDFVLIEKAGHAMSILLDQSLYRESCHNFLRNI